MTAVAAAVQPALILDGCVIPERWLPVVGYEGVYEVSDMGRVWSCDRILNDGRHWRGRMLKGRRHKKSGHRSTCRAWIEKCIILFWMHSSVHAPLGLECCHFNDIGDDNKLSNLRWDTHSANMGDMVRNGHCHKTKCVNGHELTPENTYVTPSGKKRACRTCRRSYYHPKGNYNTRKTQCANGHEFTPENTWHYKGQRHCRTCRRAAWHVWKAGKAA